MFAYCGNNPVIRFDPTGRWTMGLLLSGNITILFGVSISIGLFWDDNGNFDLQWSYSVPSVDDTMSIGAIDAGVGLSFQYTNRDSVYDLYGPATYIGASGGPGWYVGADIISFAPPAEESTTDGFQLTVGVGVGVDAHVTVSNTKPVGEARNISTQNWSNTALFRFRPKAFN